jgi:hypothetical protein
MQAQFFSGQVRLLLKRCRTLRAHLHTLKKLPAELRPHVEEIDKRLEDLDQGIQKLLADPDFGAPPLFFNQLDDYKRYAEIVNVFEWHPLALLDHYNERDHYFYRFVRLLCQQVRYPYPPPLVSAHSSEYFFSSPLTNMIGLPLVEQQFLLALADLLHELGHLFYLRHGHVIQKAFAPQLKAYISDQKQRALDESSPKVLQRNFDFLDQVWQQRYVTEFSCDMFATYLVGNAYGWSHLRLVLATRTELYHPSFGEEALHPADEARMRAILTTLEEMGGDDAALDILQTWEQFKGNVVDKSDGEYDYCYPDQLLKGLAQEVISACKTLGLVSYDQQPDEEYNLPSLIQKAWGRFHLDPDRYDEWECGKTEALQAHLLEISTVSFKG